MDKPSPCFCHKCNVSLFAEHVCLCVPTNTDDSQGVESYTTVALHDNSHNAMADWQRQYKFPQNSFPTEAVTLEEFVVASKKADFALSSAISEPGKNICLYQGQ